MLELVQARIFQLSVIFTHLYHLWTSTYIRPLSVCSSSVRISYVLSVSCVSFEIHHSRQLAAVINTPFQIFPSRGIPFISVNLSAWLLLSRLLFSSFRLLIQSQILLVSLDAVLPSMCLSSSLFHPPLTSFLVPLSYCLQWLFLSTSLPLTLNLSSVWSSDRKS